MFIHTKTIRMWLWIKGCRALWKVMRSLTWTQCLNSLTIVSDYESLTWTERAILSVGVLMMVAVISKSPTGGLLTVKIGACDWHLSSHSVTFVLWAKASALCFFPLVCHSSVWYVSPANNHIISIWKGWRMLWAPAESHVCVCVYYSYTQHFIMK